MKIFVKMKDFPRYGISNSGVVKNLNTGYILKSRKDKDGYKKISLLGKNCFIHRLVATTYIKQPVCCDVINHKDGIKTNNHVDNLEWTTVKGNTIHAYENNLNSLAVNVVVEDIVENKTYTYRSLQYAAEMLNVHLKLLISYIKFSKEYPFNNRYIITIVDIDKFIKNLNSANFGKTKYLYDVVTDKIIKYNSISMLRYDTGIRSILELKSETLLSLGYILSEEDNISKPKKILTNDEILNNRKVYLSKPYFPRLEKGIIKNLLNNNELIFNSKEELNKYFLDNYNVTDSFSKISNTKYRNNNMDKLYLGHSIRFYNNNTIPDVGEYTLEQVINSSNNKRVSNYVYKVIINNNVCYYDNILNLINSLENLFIDKKIVFKKPLRYVTPDFLLSNINKNTNIEIIRCNTIKI